MKPLQSIAMGLVIVVLSARFNDYDALADPVGWLLVYLGTRALPLDVSRRGVLLGLAALAGAVSSALWLPAVTSELYDADASLAWAANLPQLAFSGLLCHVLAARAASGDDAKAARWLGLARSATVVVALLPVLVFGAGLDSFEVTSYVAAGAIALMLIWLLFAYAARSWSSAVDESSTRPAPAS